VASFDSVGIWTTGQVHGGKHTGCKYGVVFTDVGGMAENMMVDTCQHGLSIGNAPMAFERNPMENGPGVIWPDGWSATSKSTHTRNVSSESCIVGMYVGRASHVFVESYTAANYQEPPEFPQTASAGLQIDDNCDRSVFRGVSVSGSFSVGGIVLGSPTYGAGRVCGKWVHRRQPQRHRRGGKNWVYGRRHQHASPMPTAPDRIRACSKIVRGR
jgi:hypothetical protein